MIVVPPKSEKVAFTWNNWTEEDDHILEVEIEGIIKEYHIEKIFVFEPFEINNKISSINMNSNLLFYESYLNLKNLD